MIEDYIISAVCTKNQFVSGATKISIFPSAQREQREQRSRSNSFVYIVPDPITSAATLFSIHNSSTFKVSEGMWFSNF